MDTLPFLRIYKLTGAWVDSVTQIHNHAHAHTYRRVGTPTSTLTHKDTLKHSCARPYTQLQPHTRVGANAHPHPQTTALTRAHTRASATHGQTHTHTHLTRTQIRRPLAFWNKRLPGGGRQDDQELQRPQSPRGASSSTQQDIAPQSRRRPDM